MRGLELPTSATYNDMPSPVGKLTIITSPEGLHAILWNAECIHLDKSDDDHTMIQTKNQLTEYFEGKRKKFNLPLVLNGTPFQIQVWNELQNIPYSTTISYKEQATRLGNKNKARAVGLANGQNPISIVIPCHRVIGSNGHLVGFGGGIDKKAYLLNLENSFSTLSL